MPYPSVYLSLYILPPGSSRINTLVLHPVSAVWNQLSLSSLSSTPAPLVRPEPTQGVNTWPLLLYPIGLLYPWSYSWPRPTSALPSSSPWSRIHLDFDPEKTWTWQLPTPHPATSSQPVFCFCPIGCNCNQTDHGPLRTTTAVWLQLMVSPVQLLVFCWSWNWTLKHWGQLHSCVLSWAASGHFSGAAV